MGLHLRRFFSIILTQVPVATVANDGVLCAVGLISHIHKANLRELNSVAHFKCSKMFPLFFTKVADFSREEKSRKALSSPKPTNKGFARSSSK